MKIRDQDLVAFLQHALPRLGLRWAGFRKPRGQVKKRLARRLEDLGLDGPNPLTTYRRYLKTHEDEWHILDRLCRVTISRFHRDRRIFEVLGDEVLPAIAERARREGRPARVWSAGCASGEEPYTVAVLWQRRTPGGLGENPLRVLATDVDLHLLLHRARRACYPRASLRQLPDEDRKAAFVAAGGDGDEGTNGEGDSGEGDSGEDDHGEGGNGEDGNGEQCLRPAFRRPVRFAAHDLRSAPPRGPFDLILCRNLAFTYFAEEVQRAVLRSFARQLTPGGWLALGSQEELPAGGEGWEAHSAESGLLRVG